jgi:hypothetical protein
VQLRVWVWRGAYFLSGGVLGLVVCGRASRGSPLVPGGACTHCHRRWRACDAAAVALSILVLVGAGMWLHRHMTSTGLPRCSTDLVTARGRPSFRWQRPLRSASPAVRLWRRARTALTAPAAGYAYHYADARVGGLCATPAVTVAFMPSAASDTALTVGNVFMTSLPEEQAHDIARHESAHVDQWAALTLAGGPLALPLLYGADEAVFPGARNHFERAAGLRAGNYPVPPGFGPRPRWGQLGGIAVLLALLFWRRLRWATRAVLLGAAGAEYRERGRCRLHSRGWAQIGS